jgi:hypothetical protein
MKQLILSIEYLSDVAFDRDRPRDLFIISQFEAFKHEVHLFIINIINILFVL